MDQTVATLWNSARSVPFDADEQQRLADEWWSELSSGQQHQACGALLRSIFSKCCDSDAPLPPRNWSIQPELPDKASSGNENIDAAIQEVIHAVSRQTIVFADATHEMGPYWPAWSLVGAFNDVPEHDPRMVIDSLIGQLYAPIPAHSTSSAYCFISSKRNGGVPEAVALVLERAVTRVLAFESDQSLSGQALGSLFARTLLSDSNSDVMFAVRCMMGALVLRLSDRPPVELLHAAVGMLRLAFRWPQDIAPNVQMLRDVLAAAELPIEDHPERPGEVRFSDAAAARMMQSLITRNRIDAAALSLFLEIFVFTEWGLAEWPSTEIVLEAPVLAMSNAIGLARASSGTSPLDLTASAALVEIVDRFGDGERAIITDGRLDLSLAFAGFAVYGAHTEHSAFDLDARPSARQSANETLWSALRHEGLHREAEAVFIVWLLNELSSEGSEGAAYQGTVRFLREAPSLGSLAAFSLNECLRSEPNTLLARVIENYLVAFVDGHVTSSLGRYECAKLLQDTLGSALWLRLPVHWKNTYIDMQLQWERLAPALNAGVDDLSGLVVGYAKLFESELKAKFKLLSEEQSFRETLQRDFQLSMSNNRTTLSDLCDVLSAWRKGKISAELGGSLPRCFDPDAALDALIFLREMMPIRNRAAHTSTRAAAVLEARSFFLNKRHVDTLLSFLTGT